MIRYMKFVRNTLFAKIYDSTYLDESQERPNQKYFFGISNAIPLYAKDRGISLEEAFDEVIAEMKKLDTKEFQEEIRKGVESI